MTFACTASPSSKALGMVISVMYTGSPSLANMSNDAKSRCGWFQLI